MLRLAVAALCALTTAVGTLLLQASGRGATQSAGGLGLSTLAAPASLREGGDFSPTWSPDGSRLAYVRVGVGRRQDGVYIVRRDGSKPHRILAISAADEVDWSPSGARLAIVAGAPIPTVYIRSLAAEKQVVVGRGVLPRWAPPTDQLAFLSEFHGSASRLALRRLNGKIETISRLEAVSPASWIFGGRALYISLTRNGLPGLYKLDLAAHTQRRIDDIVTFLPVGTKSGDTVAYQRLGGVSVRYPSGAAVSVSSRDGAAPLGWSPRGDKLLIQEGRRVSSVQPRSGARKVLTSAAPTGRGFFASARWSPKGRSVAVVERGRCGLYDIVVISAEGDRRPASDPCPSRR
jgi:Tol biopolymer transport system component